MFIRMSSCPGSTLVPNVISPARRLRQVNPVGRPTMDSHSRWSELFVEAPDRKSDYRSFRIERGESAKRAARPRRGSFGPSGGLRCCHRMDSVCPSPNAINPRQYVAYLRKILTE